MSRLLQEIFLMISHICSCTRIYLTVHKSMQKILQILTIQLLQNFILSRFLHDNCEIIEIFK